MRKLVILLLLLVSGELLARDIYVHGYTRRDGTYVQPHYRTAPDNTTRNNYSYRGNVNPYTGEVGTNDDDQTYSSDDLDLSQFDQQSTCYVDDYGYQQPRIWAALLSH